jgi:hypothetical protein
MPAGAAGYNYPEQRGAAVQNPYAGGVAAGAGAQAGGGYDQVTDRRYENPAAHGVSNAGYDTGSSYDAQAGQVGDRYSTVGGRYATHSDDRYAPPANRYNQPSGGAGWGDNSGSSPGATGGPSDPPFQPGSTGYTPGQTDYNPPGAKPYRSPATPYRSSLNAPGASTWRPGNTKDYRTVQSGAPTRTAWEQSPADAGAAQQASYDAPRYGDNLARPTAGDGFEHVDVGDRYSQPAATTAGGYDQSGLPLRR